MNADAKPARDVEEPKAKPAVNRTLGAFALGLVVAAAGALGVVLPSTAELEQTLGLEWLFNVRGSVRPPVDVVIVGIDGASARLLGLPENPRDWPRGLHASTVRFLSQAGAKLITFDLTFDAPSASAADDREFAAAIAQAGNVLLTDSVRRESIRLHSADGKPLGSVEIERPVPPMPALAEAALEHAPFLLPKGARVDAYWTFRGDAGDLPTLPVLATQLYATDAFERLVALLRELEPALPMDDVVRARATTGSEARRSVAATLRAAMLHPGLRGRLLERLRDGGRGIPPQQQLVIRSLLELYSSGDMSYLNYYGAARTIPTVPYHRVVEAERSLAAQRPSGAFADMFRGKAVFVGYAAASQGEQDLVRDDYRTVYSQTSGLDISGVEIAATAVANLLEGRPLQPLPALAQLAIVVVWGFVIGLVCRVLRPAQAAMVALGLAIAYAAVAYERFADATIWLPLVVPLGAQLPSALLAGLMLSYRETRRERELIKQAFGYFLPRSVVDQLARNLGPLTVNRVMYGACLATDVEKYTTLAESMNPDALGKLMNAYYAELFGPVERLGGVVDDIVGDAMVAIWAATSADANLRDNACQAALEIVAAVERFNQAVPERPVLPTRFGLHSGQMLVGSVGASRHYEYRAVGDIVNTASRIQGLNKVLGTRLLASAETVDGLQRFATRPLGSFLLVGKKSAIDIVEIVGFADTVDAERAELHALFAAAMGDYRAGRWREAADRFSAILRPDPDDGASRFYLSRCSQLLDNPPAGWTPTVRIDVK